MKGTIRFQQDHVFLPDNCHKKRKQRKNGFNNTRKAYDMTHMGDALSISANNSSLGDSINDEGTEYEVEYVSADNNKPEMVNLPTTVLHEAFTAEKTPMTLINELAKFNKMRAEYTLLDESGPAHRKTFLVCLRLSDEEYYKGTGPSIKKAQHNAAAKALTLTQLPRPSTKMTCSETTNENGGRQRSRGSTNSLENDKRRSGKSECERVNSSHRQPRQKADISKDLFSGFIPPTVELNALAMKRGEPTDYSFIESPSYDQSVIYPEADYSDGLISQSGQVGVNPLTDAYRMSGYFHPPYYPLPTRPDLYPCTLEHMLPAPTKRVHGFDEENRPIANPYRFEQQYVYGYISPGPQFSPIYSPPGPHPGHMMTPAFDWSPSPTGGSLPQRYHVALRVGPREFTGEGSTRQAAKHNAANKALAELRLLPNPKPRVPKRSNRNSGNCGDSTGQTVSVTDPVDNEQSARLTFTEIGDQVNEALEKSPSTNSFEEISGGDEESSRLLKSDISVVYDIALRKNWAVVFEVLNEKGPAHMKRFHVSCTMQGPDWRTQGEGGSKRAAKQAAASAMFQLAREELGWETCEALIQIPSPHPKTGQPERRKKVRLRLKEQKACHEYGQQVNPVSRLIQVRQALGKQDPVYTLIMERGYAKKKEFVIECRVDDLATQGQAHNKRLAKRNAAEQMLDNLGYKRVDKKPGKPLLKQTSSTGISPDAETNDYSAVFNDSDDENDVDGKNVPQGTVTSPTERRKSSSSEKKNVSFSLSRGVLYIRDGDMPPLDNQTFEPITLEDGSCMQPFVPSSGLSSGHLQGRLARESDLRGLEWNSVIDQRSAGQSELGSGNDVSDLRLSPHLVAQEMLHYGYSPGLLALAQSSTNEPSGSEESPKVIPRAEQRLAKLCQVFGLSCQYTDFPPAELNGTEFFSLVTLTGASSQPIVLSGSGQSANDAHDFAANALLVILAEDESLPSSQRKTASSAAE